MTFTPEQVWQECKSVAGTFGVDPYLIMAINEQECEPGPAGSYDASMPRMEPNFMQRYTRKLQYSSVVETLLACSWSTMQMMGESLREIRNDHGQNFFEWFFTQQQHAQQVWLIQPLSPAAVTLALDAYCVNLNWSVYWGTLWFMSKMRAANGVVHDALQRWNGGGNPEYADQVLNRIPKLKGQHT